MARKSPKPLCRWWRPGERDLCKNLVKKLVDGGRWSPHSAAPFPGTTKLLPRFMSDMDFWQHEADPHRSLSSGTDRFRVYVYLCMEKLNWDRIEASKRKNEPPEKGISLFYRPDPEYVCSDRPFDQRHRACNYELINNVLAHFSIPQPARQAIDTIAIISILSSLACLHIFGALSEECRDTVWLRRPNIPISQCFSFFLTHLLKLKNIVLKSFCECSIKIS